MTMTYSNAHSSVHADHSHVPAYARVSSRRAARRGVRAWMILAPVGALALAAGAVAVLTAPQTQMVPSQPLVEAPLAATPTIPAAPAAAIATPLEAASPASGITPEAPPAAAPVQRRVAAQPRTAPAPVVAPVEPAQPTGPRAYLSEAPATPTAAPTSPAPTTTTPPRVVIAPGA